MIDNKAYLIPRNIKSNQINSRHIFIPTLHAFKNRSKGFISVVGKILFHLWATLTVGINANENHYSTLSDFYPQFLNV